MIRRSLDDVVSLACVGFNVRNAVAFAYDLDRPSSQPPWGFGRDGHERLARAIAADTLDELDPGFDVGHLASRLMDRKPKRGDALEVTRADVLSALRRTTGGTMRELTDDEIRERIAYHPPSHEGARVHGELAEAYIALMKVVDELCPSGRDKSLAFTNLETSKMRASAAVARDPSTR